MELSKSAQEVVTQAQKLRLETGGTELCAEHLFYGILLLACYLEEPMDKPEFHVEGKKTRALLEEKIFSVAGAKHILKDNARRDASHFQAAPVLGRAMELAGDGKLTAPDLARALLENPTPVVKSILSANGGEFAAEDAKYRGGPKKGAPKAKPESDLRPSQVLPYLYALMEENGKQEAAFRENAEKAGQKVRRRTKMGLFTYHGGAVAAAIQYFLFGLLVPFAVIMVLDLVTGAVRTPPSPPAVFFMDCYAVLWLFYLLWGVVLVLGRANNALGCFFGILSALALIFMLNASVADALAASPVWLRVISSIIAFLVTVFGSGLFDHLRSEADAEKTHIQYTFKRIEGTPSKIFFQLVTTELQAPLLVICWYWIFTPEIPLWLNRALWIMGFCWVFNIFMILYTCLDLRLQASIRRGRGKGLVKFLRALHLFMGIPELVVYLHWVFGWLPVKTWVIAVLAVYGGASLPLAFLFAKDRKQ